MASARSPPAGRQPVRRPRASRPPAALGPAPRARRRPAVVRAAARHPPGSEREPARGPHRGPPDRVPRLPRHDPEGRVRRRGDDDLGQRDLRAREGRGEQDRRPLRRRTRSRSLRALPDPRQGLDDPPHGPAPRGPRPDAGGDRAHEGDAGEAAERRRGLGLRDQVGRRARDRLRAAGSPDAGEPQPARDHAAVPGDRGDHPRAGGPPGGARRRAGRLRRRRPAELPAPAAAGCTSPRHPRCAGGCATCPSPT